VLLLWLLRRRPVAFGLVAGVGALHREFTLYAVVALVALAVLAGRASEPALRRFAVVASLAFAAVVLAVLALTPLATYAGGVSRNAGWKGATQAAERLSALAQRTLPILYGVRPLSLASQNLRSELLVSAAGLGAGPLLAALALVLAMRLLRPGRLARLRTPATAFPWFLVLIGVQALVGYVLFGRGGGGDLYIRYVLLALLLPVGGLALVLQLEPARLLRAAAVSGVMAWAALNAVDHARLAAEYLLRPPPDPHRELADDLTARGIRFGRADYWTAYHVSYLAGERVKLHARSFNLIGEYRTLFLENLATAVDVRDSGPCDDGRRVAEFCVVGPPAPRRREESRTGG